MSKRDKIDDVAEDILRILDENPDPPETQARQAIQRAVDAGDCGLRQQHLKEAQSHIARVDARRNPALVRRLQADVLAVQGRGGDTAVAHVTPGEMVIPARMQTPEFMNALFALARTKGIDPRSLFVGSGRNNINPRTGMMEFADDDDSGAGYLTDPNNGVMPPAVWRWNPNAPLPDWSTGPGPMGDWSNNWSDGMARITDAPGAIVNASDTSGGLSSGPLANSASPSTDPAQASNVATITVTGKRVPQLTDKDVYLLGRMIFTEGLHDWQTPGVFQGIGSAALNRYGSANPMYAGRSFNGIINQDNQFQGVGVIKNESDHDTPWARSENPGQLDQAEAKAFSEAQRVARGLAEGILPDNTGGATLFASRTAGMLPGKMQGKLDVGSYVRTRPDIGIWTFAREPRK